MATVFRSCVLQKLSKRSTRTFKRSTRTFSRTPTSNMDLHSPWWAKVEGSEFEPSVPPQSRKNFLRTKREAESGAQTGAGLDDSTHSAASSIAWRGIHANIEPADHLSTPWRNRDAMRRATWSMHITDEVPRSPGRTTNLLKSAGTPIWRHCVI